MLGSMLWVLCKYFRKGGGGCVFASIEEDKGELDSMNFGENALVPFGIPLQVVYIRHCR